jgi:hypothetical protein
MKIINKEKYNLHKHIFTLKSGSISPSMSNQQNSLLILEAVYKAISFCKRINMILFTSHHKN